MQLGFLAEILTPALLSTIFGTKLVLRLRIMKNLRFLFQKEWSPLKMSPEIRSYMPSSKYLLFAKQGGCVLKSKIFGQKPTYLLKENHCSILWIHLLTVRQKMGIILENKVVQKLKLSKNDCNKTWAPKLLFFIEKKSEIFEWFLI